MDGTSTVRKDNRRTLPVDAPGSAQWIPRQDAGFTAWRAASQEPLLILLPSLKEEEDHTQKA